MPRLVKDECPFMGIANQPLSLATIALYVISTGCSAGRPATTSINQAKQITLYEGLPHQFYEPRALAAERKAKPTVELHGFAFYRETLDLKPGDAQQLKAILASPRSLQAFSGEKKCGGFHPDYAVEWSVGGELYRCLICFGCFEAKVHGPNGATNYDIEPGIFKRLKQLLTPYRKNRPPPSQEM
jgi:hypothetical protein